MIGRKNEQKVLTEKNSLDRWKLLLTIMKEYEYNL
jgi:hypothetical protein